MKTTLFLMTQIFPFGKGETFLEAELPILSEQFDEIQIICENIDDPQTRATPENVVIKRLRPQLNSWQKISAIGKLYQKDIIQELRYIYKYQKPQDYIPCLKVLLDSVQQAQQVSNYLEKVIKEHLDKNHKLIFYSYWLNNSALALTNIKKKYPEITCVSRAHRWDIYYDFHQPPYLPLKPQIIKKIDRVYSISEDGQSYLKNLIESSKKADIAISRLGVINANDLNLEEAEVAEDNMLWIVSCSAVIERKRIHLILEALEYLPKSTKILWQHIGDGPLLESLKAKAKEIKAENENITIEFLGYKPNSETLEYYKQHPIDLFINTSESEGIPVSIMEAMSFGIPCVGTKVGGVGEIIRTGKNGFLLPANPNASEVAYPLSRYNSFSREQKNILRKNAYKTWVEEYNARKSYEAFAQDLLTIKPTA